MSPQVTGLSSKGFTREKLKEVVRAAPLGADMLCPVCQVKVGAQNLLRHCEKLHAETYRLSIDCPSCSRKLLVKTSLSGKSAKCPSCGHVVPIG